MYSASYFRPVAWHWWYGARCFCSCRILTIPHSTQPLQLSHHNITIYERKDQSFRISLHVLKITFNNINDVCKRCSRSALSFVIMMYCIYGNGRLKYDKTHKKKTENNIKSMHSRTNIGSNYRILASRFIGIVCGTLWYGMVWSLAL